MDNKLVVKPVEFLGSELLVIQNTKGELYAAINPILRGMGFDEKQIEYQRGKWLDDRVISKGTQKFSGTLLGVGTGRDAWAITVKKLPFALAKISITPTMEREMPDLSKILERYQDQCADVLAAAFLPTEAQRPLSQAEIILQQAQFMVDFERRQKEQERALDHVSKRLDAACDAIELSPNAWREGCRKLIVRIAQKMGGNEFIRDVQTEAFKLVDERAGASLETRLTNKRRRMADEGVCKSKRDKLSKVDVIADDKKLIEVYMHIVKQMAIKYGVDSLDDKQIRGEQHD